MIGFTREEILARLRFVPLNPFRASYGYTNFGLTAGGDAAARAAGVSFEDIAEQQLLEPAGTTSSTIRYADFEAQSDRAAIHIRIDGNGSPGRPGCPTPRHPLVASARRIPRSPTCRTRRRQPCPTTPTWASTPTTSTGRSEVVADGAGLVVVQDPAGVTFPLTHWDANTLTFDGGFLLDERVTLEFTIGADGRASAITIPEAAGLGTLQRI